MQLPLAPPPWINDAICPTTDKPDTWFPGKGKPSMHTRKLAKKICTVCSVIEQCLTYAIETNEKHGIWGGQTRPERNKIKKQRAKAGVQ